MTSKGLKNRAISFLSILALASTLIPTASVHANTDTNPVILLDANSSATSVSPLLFGANSRYYFDGRGMYDPVNKEVYPDFYDSYNDAGIKAMRYPGGTVANLFKWQRAVGNGNGTNPDSGLPQVHGMDQSVMSVNFNLDEALKFTENTGTELTYMYGMGNGDPTDAANLVQYLNGTDTNNPYVQLRISNGHPAPYNITYFEIGNETGPGPQMYWLNGIPSGTDYRDAYVNGSVVNFTKQTVVLKADWSFMKQGAYKSTGVAGQEVYAPYGPPTAGTDTLYVAGAPWTRVTSFAGYGPSDQVYQIDYNTGRITFGDGMNGQIPPAGATVTITYSAFKYGYKDYYTAMKNVDPTIKVISNIADNEAIAAFRNANVPYDGMTTHPYWGFGVTSNANLTDYYAGTMGQVNVTVGWVSSLQQRLKIEPLSGGIVFPSEYGLTAKLNGYPHYLLGLGDALYIGKTLMKYMQMGIPIAEKHSLIDTWFQEDNLGIGNMAIFNNNNTPGSPYNFTPNVSAEMFKLLTNMTGTTALNAPAIVNMPTYAFSGGNNATYTQNSLNSVATKDADGNLYLHVLNEAPATDYTSTINIANYEPGSTATVWKLGEGIALDQYNLPGEAPTVVNEESTISVPGNTFTYTFPAHTMTAIKLSGTVSKPAYIGTAHYKLDETSGSTASDSSGNNNTAVISSNGGNVTWESNGKVNGALHLAPSGTNAFGDYYISIPNFFDPGATNFTIAAWVKLDQPSGPGSNQTILAQEGASGRSILYRDVNTGKLNSYLGGVTTTSNGTIPVGTWTHVALVKNGGTIQLYINGALDKTASVTTESSTGKFRVGAHKAPSATSANWNGSIDDIQLSQKALTSAQISNMYDGTIYYSMNENVGSAVASDNSGNNNTASLLTSGGSASFDINGKEGSALRLSGSYGDYYLSVPNFFDPASTDFTVAAWVKLDQASAAGSNQTIFAQEGSGGRSILYRDVNTGTLKSFLGGVNTTSTGTIPIGTWTHVALVKSGSTIKLYINGVLDTTATVTAESAAGNFRLGAHKSPSSNNSNWNGLIDEVYLAKKAFSDAQIQNLYH
ncbi:LamG-like jellyroll fold domain-containing protein [Paenibacillus sp. BK720]|uniref:LamG-like jellyroll fold domain-containing protein n=1 Tax=Paenibacillus sp. BK720 TaxID=2587092 RepID=UPI001423DB30|nr:alpha-N-arabinofuranosidase [Paenibacillus sp. BK720]